MLAYEHALWDVTPTLRVAGVDEAGRGCLAGPVVAGAVMIPADLADELCAVTWRGLTDSKQLTARQRDHFFSIITQTPGVRFATGQCTAAEIDAMNILRATHCAMARAVVALGEPVADYVLVDGLPVRGLPCPSTAIVKGDAKSLMIAAASVLAKVTRDRICLAFDTRWPQYGFAKHKGYCVKAHCDALRRYGSCPEHRHTFAPVAAVEQPMLF